MEPSAGAGGMHSTTGAGAGITPQDRVRRSLLLALERCTLPQELARHALQERERCIPRQERVRRNSPLALREMYSTPGAGAALTARAGEMYPSTGGATA